MPILRAPLKYLGNGKGRVSRQTKYGAVKGMKPAGVINRLKGNRKQ